MSMLETSLLFGGQVVRSVDCETGEVVARRENEDARSGREEYRVARNEAQALSTCHNSPQIIMRSGASLLTVKRTVKPKKEAQEGGGGQNGARWADFRRGRVVVSCVQ